VRFKIQTMPAAARAKPEDFFSPDEWLVLSERSAWRGLLLVAHCWAVIGAAITLGVLWPLTIPLVVVLVGNRQLGLFILMHDAAHGALHKHRAVNDWVGEWLCGFDLHPYRSYHLQHHRFVQQGDDPDLILSAPFPITRQSLWRKVARDLTGQTFYKQRFGDVLAKLKSTGGASRWHILREELVKQKVFYIANGLGLAAFTAVGLAWAWLLMWLLPMATWLPLISRLRNISEHALVAQDEPDPLRHARTTHANFFERIFIAPYWVNYHCEHHMFTQIACWNLPRAHRLLKRQGATARMELSAGYLTLLARASGTLLTPAGAAKAPAERV
jgi:fatty acid desaturase